MKSKSNIITDRNYIKRRKAKNQFPNTTDRKFKLRYSRVKKIMTTNE